MKRQNGVILTGVLKDLRAGEAPAAEAKSTLDGAPGQEGCGNYVMATLVTDTAAYGGHHQVLFPEEHAADALAYWALTGGNLEVAVEGWLRSTPGAAGCPASAIVIVDRVIYLSVTAAMRDQFARYKAAARHGSSQTAARPARTR
jgi:hypothetical protein